MQQFHHDPPRGGVWDINTGFSLLGFLNGCVLGSVLIWTVFLSFFFFFFFFRKNSNERI